MISREVDYALRALVELAKKPEREWTATAQLSRELRVSRVYLAKIFQRLARKGLLETAKGKQGGVRLKSRNTSLTAVLKALEPHFSLNKCLNQRFRCFRQASCPIHAVLAQVQQELFAKLNRYTLKRLARKA
ncbi:MAG: Rrf2 family transcriptional regulator [Candidatus Margulisbacteria bacterium]|jgi:Rrf2 family nitric oxide-sensitive transcriptional repressor|nr:Rrf2 family transcriptional regulator [Candidatus Margulisiibacteriota bacterium]